MRKKSQKIMVVLTLLLMLPLGVVNAIGKYEQVEKVEITDVKTSFKAGDKVTFTGSVPEGSKYSVAEVWCSLDEDGYMSNDCVYSDNFVIHETNSNCEEDDSECEYDILHENAFQEFEAGKAYRYRLFLIRNEGVIFSPYATFKILTEDKRILD